MSAGSVASEPLRNLTILVACSAKKMVELASGLEALGGKVLALPLIEAQEIPDKRKLDEALNSLEKYTWIIFTSAYGVSFFMRRWEKRGGPKGSPDMPKICAVGPATASALREYGLEAALIPENFVAEGVIESLDRFYGGLERLSGCRILLPRAKEGRDVLPAALSAAGARVDVLPCYETVRAKLDEAILRQARSNKVDLAVFTSSSAVRNLMDILGPEDGKRILRDSTVAVLGPVTGSTVARFGKQAEIVPDQNTVASLVLAIGDYFSERKLPDSK